MRTVIYTRVSHDPNDAQEGVAAQERVCREYAAQRGWSVMEVCVDNNISGYHSRHRSGFARLQELVKNQRVDVILARDQTRLLRNTRRALDLYDLCIANGVELWTCWHGRMDTNKTMFSIMAVLAEAESDAKSERQLAMIATKKHKSLPVTAGRRPFGYDRAVEAGAYYQQLQPCEPEAELLREAYARIAAGESLYAVVRDWNSGTRTVPVPEHRDNWSGNTLKSVLLRPVNASLYSPARVPAQGTVRGTRRLSNEEERALRLEDYTPGDWPALIDRDTWWLVRTRLLTPRETKPEKWATKSLLGGIARCASCDYPLYQTTLNPRTKSGAVRSERSQNRYLCSARTRSSDIAGSAEATRLRSMPHCSGPRELVDEVVTSFVLTVLSADNTLDILEASDAELEQRDELRRERDQTKGRLDELALSYADGRIQISTLETASEPLRKRLLELDAALAPRRTSAVLEPFQDAKGTGITAAEVWQTLTLDQQRAVIKELVTVHVTPSGRGGGKAYTSDNIKINVL